MSTLWKVFFGIALVVLVCSPGPSRAQAPSGGSSSSLPALQTAVVSSVGYADLTYAAREICKTKPCSATTIVLYDSQAFTQLAAYRAALLQVRLIRRKLCDADQPGGRAAMSGLADLSGLTGAASFIQLFVPTYNNASATLLIPTAALVAALVNTLKASDGKIQIIAPSYVLPSLNPQAPTCNDIDNDNSFYDQWIGANVTVASLRKKVSQEPDAEKKKKLQALIDEYDLIYKTLTTSEKGDPLLPRLLAAENLSSILAAAQDPSKLAVLEVQLDLVGADSVTRVWFGFIKTIFSADVLVLLR